MSLYGYRVCFNFALRGLCRLLKLLIQGPNGRVLRIGPVV